MRHSTAVARALMVMLGLGSALAGSASATEGPFWKVNGTRLAAGQTRLLLASAKEKFIIEVKAVGLAITCQGLTLPVRSEMQIIGQAPGNGGTSEEAIEFTSCTVTGNGSSCEVENGKIKTTLLLGLLGYSNASRIGQVLALFEPAIGKTIASLKFVGEGCTFIEANLEGRFVGGARINGGPILTGLVGGEGESTHGELKFPHTQLLFIERGGSLQHVKASLISFGIATTLAGTMLFTLDESGIPVKWGVFS